jgi:signal transduction histidine kinase
MIRGMAATPRTPAAPVRDLRRDRDNGMVAGVCAGLGKRFGVDPLLLRILFAATTIASGIGLVAYVLAWILLPAEGADDSAARALTQGWGRRGTVEVALGVGFLLLAVLLAFRKLGLPFSDVLIWPLVLVAAGAALIWHRSASADGDPIAAALPRVNLSATASAVLRPAAGESRPAVISRIGIGVTLVIAAAIVFLQFSGALAAATDVALAALVVAIAFGVIFAPWFVRLLTSLTAERAERIRSQERAEVAAHLHDSVLQTLALVQKRAGDPRAVAALARRQERELRTWLSGAPAVADGERRLAAALEAAAQEIEERHGVAVDVVAVGDAPLDRDGEALIGAAREAMLNAAKFGGGGPVAVYAEAADGRLQVFVRDRGPGFDPQALPADRRGVRESIVGRMQRHGGRATIHASPGGGTEVELVLERAPS